MNTQIANTTISTDANAGAGTAVVSFQPVKQMATSLAALMTGPDQVDTSRSSSSPIGLWFMLFDAKKAGVYTYGPKQIVPDKNSWWAVNMLSCQWGYISFGKKEVVGEILVPATEAMPDKTKLPSTGYEWQEEWTINMKCVRGIDAGVEVMLKFTSDGGDQFIRDLIAAFRDRVDSGAHIGLDIPVPVIMLDHTGYDHKNPKFGHIFKPIWNIVDWLTMPPDAAVPQESSLYRFHS
jgi:hypothetical protein